VSDLGFYALVGASAVVGFANLAFAWVFVRRFWRPSLRFAPRCCAGTLAHRAPSKADECSPSDPWTSAGRESRNSSNILMRSRVAEARMK
jgi:hypothetical protein